MEKSGFFNAIKVDGVYDRQYNANDYCDNLAVVIGNGVLRSENDDLKVTASGLIPKVNIGRGWIEGHYYNNTSVISLPAVEVPAGGARIDRVVLRLDKSVSVRSVSIYYLHGDASANPTPPPIGRDGTIYDLLLADIRINAGATNLIVTDKRADSDVCGWVYSTSGDGSFFTTLDNDFATWFADKKDTLASVTLFKKYSDEITLAIPQEIVPFSIPQYDDETCFLEVYVNGFLSNDYTVSGSSIVFAHALNAGTKVTVYCFKSIDGTGIMSVADEITQLQNQVAQLTGVSKFAYYCTGANDNVALSEIAAAIYAGEYTVGSLSAGAEAFLSAVGGNVWLGALEEDSQVTIDVTGKLGATSAYQGAGTAVSPYKWFALGQSAKNEKRIVFDFAHCDIVKITCADDTKNQIFAGSDVHIKNLKCVAKFDTTVGDTDITMFSHSAYDGSVEIEGCDLTVETTGAAAVATNGRITNSRIEAISRFSSAYAINGMSGALLQVENCKLLAYSGIQNSNACFGFPMGDAMNATAMAHNINCPVADKSGLYQDYYLNAGVGFTQIYGIVTLLDVNGISGNYSVEGLIARNKP